MYSRHTSRGGYLVKVSDIGDVTNYKQNIYDWGYVFNLNRQYLYGIKLGMKGYGNSIIVDFTNFYNDSYVQSIISDPTYHISGGINIEDNEQVIEKIEFHLMVESTIDKWDSKYGHAFTIRPDISVDVANISLYFGFHKNSTAISTPWTFGRVYNLTSNATVSREAWGYQYYPLYHTTKYKYNEIPLSRAFGGTRLYHYQGGYAFGLDTWNTDTPLNTTSTNVPAQWTYNYSDVYPTP